MDVQSTARQHPAMQPREKTCATNISAPDFAWLGKQPYVNTWERMQQQVQRIQQGASGEIIWSCEHEPVYTTGRRGIDNRRQKNLPATLIHTERGGETTYHGPGQLMLYPLISLRSRKLGVRDYAYLLEQSCIDLLQTLGIAAEHHKNLPGVWKNNAKIAALGLRVSHGIVWHGMALNVSVQQKWFSAINACGTGLKTTRLSDHMQPPPLVELADQWYALLCRRLSTASEKP